MAIRKLQDFSRFPDCSALSEMGRCTRLTVFSCQGEKCSFKRSSEEDQASIKYANHRLLSLDSSIQGHIARKYYGGFMPWKEEQPATMNGHKRTRFSIGQNKNIELKTNEK